MNEIQMNPAFKMLITPPELKIPITGEIKGDESFNLNGKVSEIKDEKSFLEILKESVEKVNNLQNEADNAIKKIAMGEPQELHETIIAIQKANISFKMMMEVRNKLISAYKEVMNMRV